MRLRWLAIVALLVSTAAAERPKKPHEHGALVIVIDRSGSMQGARLDAAKAATKAAIKALDPSDEVAVIAFDSEAKVVVARKLASKVDARDIDRVQAGGGTTFLPALELAHDALAKVKGKKLVVLLTDGEVPSDGLVERVTKMHDDGIVTSCVGVVGADRTLLTLIQEAGDGRLYMVGELSALPKVFVREVEAALPR